MKTVLITCGETSGDHHAARLVSAMREKAPGTRFIAMGGDALRAAGAEVRFSISEYAFMGFSEVVKGIPRIRKLERELAALMSGGGIDLYIPVDYPGMNLRVAASAKRAGVPVLYFISPQVWAWAGWRIGKMRRLVDLMAVILPFEEEYYREQGIPVFFAGNPMTDEIAPPQRPKEAPHRHGPFDIILFPGSRRQEVQRHIGPMLGAARLIRKKWPLCRFRLGAAPLIDEGILEIPVDMRDCVDITRGGTDELGSAGLVLASSGTVTLQTALSGTPMVVVYRTSWITYLLARAMVRIPHIAMPNVLAGREIVPELVQGDAEAERIAASADSILSDAGRYEEISAELLSLRTALERDGGLEMLAEKALRMAAGDKIDTAG